MVTNEEAILAKLSALEHKLDDAMTKVSSDAVAAEIRKLSHSLDELKSTTQVRTEPEGFVDTLKTASKDAVVKLINSENLLTLLSAVGNNIKDMDSERILDVSAAINNIITTLQHKDSTIVPNNTDIVRDFSDMLDARIRYMHKQCEALFVNYRSKTASIDKDVVAVCLANDGLAQKALKDYRGDIAHPIILDEHHNSKDLQLFQTVALDGTQINIDVYLNIVAVIMADLQCWRDMQTLALLNNQFMYLNTTQYLDVYHSLRDRNIKKAVAHIQTEVCEDGRTQILAPLQECSTAQILHLDKMAERAQTLGLQTYPDNDAKILKECKQKMHDYIDELMKANKLAIVHKEIRLLEHATRVELVGTIHSKISEWSHNIDSACDILLQQILPISHNALMHKLRIMAVANYRPECINVKTQEYHKVDIITATQDIFDRNMKTQVKLDEIVSQSTLKGIQIAEACLHYAQQHIAHITDNYQTFIMSGLMPIILHNLHTLHSIEVKIIANTSEQKADAQSTVQTTQRQIHNVFSKVANTFVKAIAFATTAFTSILSKTFAMVSLMLEQLLNILQATKSAISSATNAFGNIVPQLFSVIQVLAESSARIVNTVLSVTLVGVEALFGTVIHILQSHTVLSAMIMGVIYSSYKIVSHWLTTAYSGIGMFYMLTIFIFAMGTVIVLKTAIYASIDAYKATKVDSIAQ